MIPVSSQLAASTVTCAGPAEALATFGPAPRPALDGRGRLRAWGDPLAAPTATLTLTGLGPDFSQRRTLRVHAALLEPLGAALREVLARRAYPLLAVGCFAQRYARSAEARAAIRDGASYRALAARTPDWARSWPRVALREDLLAGTVRGEHVSAHAWGAAVSINAASNAPGFGRPWDMPRWLVARLRAAGFAWEGLRGAPARFVWAGPLPAPATGARALVPAPAEPAPGASSIPGSRALVASSTGHCTRCGLGLPAEVATAAPGASGASASAASPASPASAASAASPASPAAPAAPAPTGTTPKADVLEGRQPDGSCKVCGASGLCPLRAPRHLAGSRIALDVEWLRQTQEPWRDDTYWSRKDKTVRAYGCHLTSRTMVLGFLGRRSPATGKRPTPREMNEHNKRHGDAYHKYPDGNQNPKVKYHTQHFETRGRYWDRSQQHRIMARIDELLDRGVPVVVDVVGDPKKRKNKAKRNDPPSKKAGHYVVVYGRDGQGGYLIRDPGYSRRKTLDCYVAIGEIRWYEKVG